MFRRDVGRSGVERVRGMIFIFLMFGLYVCMYVCMYMYVNNVPILLDNPTLQIQAQGQGSFVTNWNWIARTSFLGICNRLQGIDPSRLTTLKKSQVVCCNFRI